MNANISYDADGTLTIANVHEVPEDEFMYYMTRHFFGENMALAVVMGLDDDVPDSVLEEIARNGVRGEG